VASYEKVASGIRAYIQIKGAKKSKTFPTKREAKEWVENEEAKLRVTHADNGSSNVGETSGNIITFGSLGIANVHVLVISDLEIALLGAEVLNAFDISHNARMMLIKGTNVEHRQCTSS
jgi:hypothetical protein